MESVGHQLREARVRLGFTLEDVSASTRINVKKVAAIECDDTAHFSSRFLYKSFVRQIAVTVRVGGEVLEPSLAAVADSIPEPLVPGQVGVPLAPEVVGLKPQRVLMSRWIYSVALLVIMLVACSTLFALWQNSRFRTEASADVHSLLQAVTRSSSPKNASAHSPIVATVASATKPAIPPNASADDFHIQVSASAPTWVSVTSDGEQVFSGILQAEETKVLDGHETARIRTGNAGGVQVVFNGRSIGALGTNGQVRTAVFNRNGYEILEPQANAEAGPLHDTHSALNLSKIPDRTH